MRVYLGLTAYLFIGLVIHYLLRVYDEYQQHRERCQRRPPLDLSWLLPVFLWALAPLFILIMWCFELTPYIEKIWRDGRFSPARVAARYARWRQKKETLPQPDPESYRDLEDTK